MNFDDTDIDCNGDDDHYDYCQIRHDDRHQPHEMLPEVSTNNQNDEIVADLHNASMIIENPKNKKKRHGARNQNKMKYLVRWIHDTFLNRADSRMTLPQQQPSAAATSSTVVEQTDHHYVLDVAGGKGELAARLVMCCKNIHVTMVDPRKADIASVYQNWIVPKLPKKWQELYFMKSLENDNFVHDILAERCKHFQMYFTNESVNGTDDTLRKAIEECTLMIGMHADSATECIVDVALQYRKPFVVVPCCVFPNLFSQRFLTVNVSDDNDTSSTAINTIVSTTIKDENVNRLTTTNSTTTTKKIPVRSYEQFCDYLYQKDERFQRTVLPFDGRNIAIWWDGK